MIEKHFQTDLIDGITTNPTLIMKSGRNPEDVYQQLIDMGIDDISMEVVGDFDEMYMEGLRLSRKFGKNASIKVPCTPAGLKVCKKLSRDLVNVNVTLIFSAAQAILAAKAGAKYVSPFVGRVDDNSFNLEKKIFQNSLGFRSQWFSQNELKLLLRTKIEAIPIDVKIDLRLFQKLGWYGRNQLDNFKNR